MTKKEIVKVISDRMKESQVRTKEVVQMTFDLIVETLVKEGRIELRNFGVFEVKRRKPRRARNPRTNQPVEVEAKNVVTFQPGKVMEEKVRKAEKVAESRRKPRKPAAKPTPPVVASRPPEPPSADDDRELVGAAVGGGSGGDYADEFGTSGRLPNKPR